jgi:plastocyanin domain-containing protein
MLISGNEWLAVIAGLAAIAWVNWYFVAAGRAPTAIAASRPGEPQLETIVVDGGYTPAAVRVKAGQPVRLVFDRRDTGSCTDEVVFPDFGIRRFLPTGKKTAIDITPPKAGRYEFTCGMSMHHGALVAED